MPDTELSVLSIKEFPAQLLTDLKMAALRSKMTLRDYVIANLQQLVDNGTNPAPAKRK
jgi:hypothetical protein